MTDLVDPNATADTVIDHMRDTLETLSRGNETVLFHDFLSVVHPNLAAQVLDRYDGAEARGLHDILQALPPGSVFNLYMATYGDDK